MQDKAILSTFVAGINDVFFNSICIKNPFNSEKLITKIIVNTDDFYTIRKNPGLLI